MLTRLKEPRSYYQYRRRNKNVTNCIPSKNSFDDSQKTGRILNYYTGVNTNHIRIWKRKASHDIVHEAKEECRSYARDTSLNKYPMFIMNYGKT